MANHLMKITNRAKQIRRGALNKKWTMCVKQAAAELKREHKIGSRPKKRATVKRRVSGARKAPARPRRRIGNTSQPGVGIQAISGIHGATETQLRGAMLLKLEQQLGQHYIKRDRAKLKRDKKAWGKIITETKAKIRRLRP